jgi:hypothetical protein
MKNSFDFLKLTDQHSLDHFGRKYPFRISLVKGEVFNGSHAGNSSTDKGCDLIWFKVIEDLNEWITNKDHIGTRMIYLKPEEILKMVVYNDYSKNRKES